MKLDWKQVIVAFVLGAALGTAVTTRCAPFGSHGAWKNPEKFHERMMQQFASKLQLTPDQQQKVSTLLDDARAQIDALRKEIHPKFEAVRNASRTRIRQLLTSDQQKKFDQMSAELDARMEKHRAQFAGKDKNPF